MTETPGTSDFSFSGRDVQGLISALGSVAGGLTDKQWGLLLAIFAAAAGDVHVDDVSDDRKRGTFHGIEIGEITDHRNKKVTDLRRQLQNARVPGKGRGAPLRDMIIPPKTTNPPPPRNRPAQGPVTLLAEKMLDRFQHELREQV